MKKKSIKKSSKTFIARTDQILRFLDTKPATLGDDYDSWVHDYAVIRLYRDFEVLMLDALIGAINNDTATLSRTTGFNFTRHLTDEVCGFLVTGTGYFDFQGRDGLIKILKRFVPSNHYLLTIISHAKYKSPLDKLTSLRNFAAHNSRASKKRVLAVLKKNNIASSGSWLKRQNRFRDMVVELQSLAQEIHSHAPY
jgi:hypothetical protein